MRKATHEKPLIEKRVRKHPFLGKRYFSDDYGFFTVKKIWSIHTWSDHSEPHENSWMKFEIKTCYGKIILMSHHFKDIVFKQEY